MSIASRLSSPKAVPFSGSYPVRESKTSTNFQRAATAIQFASEKSGFNTSAKNALVKSASSKALAACDISAAKLDLTTLF